MIVATLQARRNDLKRADQRWEQAFFAAGTASAEVEAARLAAAAALMRLRILFAPIHLDTPVPAVAWEVEDMASVARRHRHRLEQPSSAFEPLREAPVEASRGFLTDDGIEGWIRFPTPVPSVGDTAWARICAPAGHRGHLAPAAIPSVIFCHGIGMEPEFWGESHDPIGALVGAGIRTIRPEAPWHGRRRLPHMYGGEPILARGPGGLLDFFHAHVVEIGELIAWARATRGGPVAVGGVSLGALTAQLVAVAARHWPEEKRPDALFLVAPSLSMAMVAFSGSLTRGLGVPEALAEAGWTREGVLTWVPLLEPTAEPVVAPERTVVVIGEADDVTLAEGGEALVRAWQVPADNVFRGPAGHFSTSLGLSRDAAPLRRLRDILAAPI
jgi:pimeloyl-ACP methyl ester carboxylesterase